LECIFPVTSNHWSTVTESYSKVNRMLGLVKWTIEYKILDFMIVRLYKSLVRPHLQYFSPVWSPHYRKDKIFLEKVQHCHTRIFDDFKELEYNERLRKLKLWTLEDRRNHANCLRWWEASRQSHWTHFCFAEETRTRGHSYKMVKLHSRCDVHFFSVRVVNHWNDVPQEAVAVTTVNSFKSHLDRIQHNQMDINMNTQSAKS